MDYETSIRGHIMRLVLYICAAHHPCKSNSTAPVLTQVRELEALAAEKAMQLEALVAHNTQVARPQQNAGWRGVVRRRVACTYGRSVRVHCMDPEHTCCTTTRPSPSQARKALTAAARLPLPTLQHFLRPPARQHLTCACNKHNHLRAVTPPTCCSSSTATAC